MRAPEGYLDTLSWRASYAQLPAHFYARVSPSPVQAPSLVRINHELAQRLGLDPEALARPESVEVWAGNRTPAGSDPIAMAYAGHQFGHWVPRLGDGRALLLGELPDRAGTLCDLQLKGSGPTPFSRSGDGRAPIGPVVREYLGSEALAGLGIPTTRALAAVTTGEQVQRWGLEPGGVLARVARGHVRVGTFEYFAHRGDNEAVRQLADYVLWRHYPAAAASERRYHALLEAVTGATADLIGGWLSAGFIHGVMNTDNLSLAGETIDFGPFGFLDAFQPQTVYSSIDAYGRYAYDQQPGIAAWNLARLAEALLPLMHRQSQAAAAEAEDILRGVVPRCHSVFRDRIQQRLGWLEAREGDDELVTDLLQRMAEGEADWTLTFRRLSEVDGRDASGDGPVRALFREPQAFDAWASAWRQRLAAEGRDEAERRAAMRAVNPAYILRNHLAEWAAEAATRSLDFQPMERLLKVLAAPYVDYPEEAELGYPPHPGQRVTRTFCGT